MVERIFLMEETYNVKFVMVNDDRSTRIPTMRLSEVDFHRLKEVMADPNATRFFTFVPVGYKPVTINLDNVTSIHYTE